MQCHTLQPRAAKPNDIYDGVEDLDFLSQEMTPLGIKEGTTQHAGPRRLGAAASRFDGDAHG